MMWLLPAICLFACVLCIIFESKNLNKLSLKAKLLASLSFVGFAWQLEAMTTVFGKLLLSGLVLSMIGDVLLAIINHKRAFILGMIAFLIAHVMYALAFYQLGFNTAQLPLLLPVVMLMMLGTGLWLRPHLHGVFAFAVPMYLLAIGTMLILAWGNLSLTAWWPIVLGASLFAISDLLVARQRFIQPDIRNRIIGLPMYYLAQLTLAVSLHSTFTF